MAMPDSKNYRLIKNSRAVRPADIALTVIAAVILLTAFMWIRPQGKGEFAYIYSGDTLIKVMPLTTDDEFVYSYQGHFNVIRVQGGAVSISQADCPDKICVNSAPASVAGSSIVCLPHNLFIVIVGSGGVDDQVRLLWDFRKNLFCGVNIWEG